MPEENKADYKKEAKNQTIGYIVAALGLVAGLAWNDAIKALIDFIFPIGGNSIWLKFIYALLITIIIVLVSFFLLKPQKDKN